MFEYRSQKELYDGLVPAMKVKLSRLKVSHCDDIAIDDIWNFLRDYKWRNSVDLTLGEMVHDIIHVDYLEILKYVKNKKSNVEGNE